MPINALCTIHPQQRSVSGTWEVMEEHVVISAITLDTPQQLHKWAALFEYNAPHQCPSPAPALQRVPTEERDGLVEIRLSLQCDNYCDHCFISDRDQLQTYSKQQVFKLIDDTDADVVLITGGEPTLHADFLEIIQYVTATQRRVLLQSHGRAFANPEFTALAAPHLWRVLIPVHHSDDAQHDKIVHVEGASRETWRGLHNLQQHSHIIIATQTVITYANYQDILSLADRIQSEVPGAEMTITYPHAVGGAANSTTAPTLEAISSYLQPVFAKYGRLIDVHYIPPCYIHPHTTTVHSVDVEKAIDELSLRSPDKAKLDILQGQWQEVRANELFDHYIKADQCASCIFSPVCHGIPKTYSTVLGHKFDPIPVQDPYAEAILNMKLSETRKYSLPLAYREAIFHKMWQSVSTELITSDCNYTCEHCYATNFPRLSLTLEEFKQHVDQTVLEKRHSMVDLFGYGEPTLHPDYLEMLKYVRSVGLSAVTCGSGGSRFSDRQFFDTALELGLNELTLSIVSDDPELAAKITGDINATQNAFKILGYMHDVKQRRDFIPIVLVPLTRRTLITLESTVDTIQRIYPRVTTLLSACFPYGRAETTDLLPAFTELQPTLHRIFERYQDSIMSTEIPLCIIAPYHNTILMRESGQTKEAKQETFVQLPSCSVCVEKNRCPGILKKHLEFYPFTPKPEVFE